MELATNGANMNKKSIGTSHLMGLIFFQTLLGTLIILLFVDHPFKVWFVVSFEVTCFFTILLLHRRDNEIKNELGQISDALDAFSCGISFNRISVLRDELPSKIQDQLTGLDEMWVQKYNQLSDEKDRLNSLISDISHQVKTPLANLRLYDGMLEASNIKEEERLKFYKKKRDQYDRLEWLLTSLIKLSRIETGLISLSLKPCSMETIIMDSIDMILPKAAEKNTNIKYESIKDVEIKGDRKWLSEAFFNIIENGVKYSKNGSPVRVSMDDNNLFVCVRVDSLGHPIPENEYNNIFKRFYRMKMHSEVDGLGIGLYLSREIITRHDGYITIECNNGGNRFSIFIPKRAS